MWGWGWGNLGHAAYGFPFFWLGFGFRAAVLAAFIIGIVYLARYFARRGGGPSHHEESALEILQKRYARGEITKEQYEEMKRDLG